MVKKAFLATTALILCVPMAFAGQKNGQASPAINASEVYKEGSSARNSHFGHSRISFGRLLISPG